MKLRIVSIVLSIILATWIVSCTANSQQREIDTAEPTKTPVVVKEWTGIGNKITEPFVINSDVWYISWSLVPEPIVGIYANLLMVDVKKPNYSFYTSSLINIANVDRPVNDSTYVYEKGTFYLDINSMSGEWSIRVIAFE